ncbi:LPS export ABC transporter permease LptF [Alteromonas sp. KS69]|jgi:lipopolysaccharide export system permease protein|uniref:Lipopolysaccharide export system permease protein LptF n=1 Tax=Alteromonas naphthalenivorans TaxID=715451 RepID=F5Z9J0_ALTNA|nr:MULTISPECIES: LPS export ABC transporter permease LptF [Alteromonas]MBB67206.1 LPS export ABC transporter permease LptF [Rickettsiales bacterium]PHS50747.1 MAG: LPS export ABC transporter permease LptF [Alteromonas sp.]AEF01835.1 permease YjgP/YjgQ [Alteromonas naphthalenivorans]MBO7923155.1 LPS export ABC transporter permease LptF [Alteromonas sp. K632G]MCQ8848439.1 LPS export ABC transporter permease LptF [Alteromonas stellipolaris]|tara:strand:+ start:215 stop:1315 length:1101 start_codon:yes stop_codon:yes gene_type:complete
MLIFRYLLKETLKSQLAIFFILMAIFVTLRFVRVLGDASDGDIPAGLVLGFLGLYAPILASLVLPISAYLGIMLAHGRLYVDSEMTVMRACGISEWYITRVMLFLSVLIMIVTGAITLYFAPMAAENEYQLREKARNEAGLSAIIPGRFQQTGNAKAVIFVHDIDTDDQLRRVFLSQNKTENGENQVQVVYAQTGQVASNPDGTRNLVLKQGVQYEGQQSQKSYRKVEFDEYQIQIADKPAEEARRKVSVLPTTELWGDESIEARAELQWRIAIPLSLPFLILIAVPLSAVDPRQGRFGKMFPAILLYLGYFLLLLASRRVLEDGKIPPQLGLWWVHTIMLIIGVALIVRDRKTGTQFRAWILGKK